jgi:hypothetical protein
VPGLFSFLRQGLTYLGSSLELKILLPLPGECWDYRPVLPSPACNGSILYFRMITAVPLEVWRVCKQRDK